MSLLPKLPAHRPSATVKRDYERLVLAFCSRLIEVRSSLDFEVGSRGWAYILEGERAIDKDEIDTAQKLINDARKAGYLPLDFCSEDGKRAADNLEEIEPPPAKRAAEIVRYVRTAEQYYTPFSFWNDLNVFVQMAVEKSNLKYLFAKTCEEFCVPIANVGGWADLNVRGGFMQRFREKEAEGKRCVLLYFGDFDPGGLHISNTLRSNFEEMGRATGWSPGNLVIDRFGLDIDFIERNNLTWIDNLATAKGDYPLNDRRHPDHNKPYVQEYLRAHGVRKVESDALLKNPEAGRELCRQAILKYVPASAPRRYLNKLKPFRAELRREIDRLLRKRP